MCFSLDILLQFDALSIRLFDLTGSASLMDGRTIPIASLFCLRIVAHNFLCVEPLLPIFKIIIRELLFDSCAHVRLFIFFINKLEQQ